MKLRSFSYFIGLIIIFFCSPFLGEEKIDIWKNKKDKKQTIENKKTPENVRFVSLKVSNKKQITIAGVAKDDQSVIEMMNNLTILSSVKESKIETLIELSEDDRIALYTTEGEAVPKLEDLPKETIAKKFTISLKLNPVEGEKFDDEKNYAVLVERTKKK